MMKRVLVTGGAGYIGSHTAKALCAVGCHPIVFDNLSAGYREAVQWGPLVVGDVRDADALAHAMRLHAVNAVIHFAGLIEVGRSMREPLAFWDANVGGTAAVLEAMRLCGVERIVLSSTAAVYGQPDGVRALTENLPLNPINPYGDTKVAAERMVANACLAHGMTGVALRYFNASGADPAGRIGEAHDPETHLIPLAIEAALGLGRELEMFGTDFPTLDGTCVRDYIHVEDLAQAHVLALNHPLTPGTFTPMNLGAGAGCSVLEVLQVVGRVVGRPAPHRIAPRRAGDPACLVADPGRAHQVLGWRARHSDLETIVASAMAWRRAPAFGKRFQRPSGTLRERVA
ncbi:MAG TPA: UDP-glucose 4-epimerase GalE [Brevundimonas sp.]|jgi:UDP-glucose 4-epimerase/UDP-arabinose 4-epimerase|uniref:UDP-glucose 4-epimerase GalE n=1 Tax=Brevundimonas sp. TaxID=1871086 RepID=UPI002E1322A5|nr:UDP-glucose 4-epimerase GalE [Brevundimonas sp.]